MKKIVWVKIIITFLLIGNVIPAIAEETNTSYTLLEPGVFGGEVKQVTSFSDYANRIFSVILAIAIALAILMIVLGGFEYITSASGAGKGDGKKKIQDALLGLLIILISYLILNTINPDLVKWKFEVTPLGGSAPSGDAD